MNVNGYDTCLCDTGFGAIDCSATTPTLPQIIPAFGAATPPQYTKKDPYGDANPLFDELAIATIWMEVAPDDLEFIMNPANAQTKDYKKASFTFFNGNMSTVVSNITTGLRIKGGASRQFVKKSWKISFNQYADQTVYGMKKLLLKSASMNPDLVRERISRDLIYSMGAAVERMSYANLYINGLFRGLYIEMDDIDNTFLKSRFGSNNGGLWKITLSQMQPTLMWQGPSCDNYSIPVQYQPENDYAESNCQVLVHLIDVLNNAPDSTFEHDVQQIFDVQYYLRTLVVEVLSGNWDGGSYDGNNYYLYYDTSTTPALFKYIRQDLDMSWGSNSLFTLLGNMSVDLRTGDIFSYGTKVFGRFLTKRILNTPSFRQTYVSYMSALLDTYLNLDPSSAFMQRMNLMHDSVTSSIQQDYWHRLDLQMSFKEFQTNIHDLPVTRPLYLINGTQYTYEYASVLLDWAQDRIATATSQINP